MHPAEPVALHDAARRRYLSYALSVITSRALPDVRDGLKPVQRRILYAMLVNLGLRPEGRYRKSAAVVGEVMAKYHPHGDSSIYEAMVRMAQSFSLLHPLVDGQGNFGSLDGDPPAAMRYTEAKLRPIAMLLLDELGQQTVAFRPNYDGQGFEPVVLPAQYPQLLVNGVEGIAVGMATKIPPHNLSEIIDACVMLVDDPATDVQALCRKVRGPDFPTGGLVLDSPSDLRTIYETGQGPVNLRGTWTLEKQGRKAFAIITSIPYATNKSELVSRIGAAIADRKLPQLIDVRDESTDDVRVVLELRRAEDIDAAMAWLCKHTPLQSRFSVNLTCLIPGDNPEVGTPARLDLRDCLWQWLLFRFETVRRRFEFELGRLRERIHILEGFEKIFDCLDEAIRIIRASEGKRDAAEKLMDRFDLDDAQADAILELKLYRLAKLEILVIQQELAQKRAEAERIEGILASDVELWGVVRSELLDVKKKFGQKRRTEINADAARPEYNEDAYIVAEDAWVILTREGWVKRQASLSGLDKVRLRDGDTIGWVLKASTRSTLTFLSSAGSAYTMRVDDVPSTTGYGDPVQKHFAFADGERVVGLVSHDPRHRPRGSEQGSLDPDYVPPPHVVCVTRQGRGLRISMDAFAELSTKSGRRYCKVEDGDAVVSATRSGGTEIVSIATEGGNMLAYSVSELATVRGPGKGFTAIKLDDEDRVLAFGLFTGKMDGVKVLTAQGREEVARLNKFEGSRGGKGASVVRRGGFTTWVREPEVQNGESEEGGEE